MRNNDVAIELWKHQKAAVDFVWDKSAAGLFLDMGCGKTAIALEVIRRNRHKLTLVVMPKNVLISEVWLRELDRIGGSYSVCQLVSLTSKDKCRTLGDYIRNIDPVLDFPHFVFVNYDSVWRSPLKQLILQIKWSCVILDEAHRIKSAGSKVSKFFATLARRNIKQRLALTGTPMPNSPLDVYGLCRFIDPTVFGTNFGEFQSRYAIMGGYNRYQVLKYVNLDELYTKLAAISYRVETNDVLQLPEVMHVTRHAVLESAARKIYTDLNKEMLAELNDVTVVADNVLVKLLRLQQLAGGFFADKHISLAKEELLGDVLDDLPTHPVGDGTILKEPVVIFARFMPEIDAIRAVAAVKGYSVAEVSGRMKELHVWQGGMANCLVVQIQAGSEGIDLTHARYAIFYSKVYSLGIYQQALARLHRPGQVQPVCYIHLAVRNTVDIDIEACLRDKKNIIQYLIEQYRVGLTQT